MAAQTNCLTRQEYYDLLVKTSEDGGFPARDYLYEPPPCKYRTSDGKKCAIGIIMPDNFYGEEMEGKSISVILDFAIHNFSIPVDWIPEGMTVADLYLIQYIHDNLPVWDHKKFVEKLNETGCFRELKLADEVNV